MADDYSISNLIRCSELPSVLTLGLNVARFPFIVSPSGVIGGASGVPGVPYRVNLQVPNPLSTSANSPFLILGALLASEVWFFAYQANANQLKQTTAIRISSNFK
jgi:hypothetical protein